MILQDLEIAIHTFFFDSPYPCLDGLSRVDGVPSNRTFKGSSHDKMQLGVLILIAAARDSENKSLV